MNVFASAHSQGIAKGFGMGMAVVLLAYAGLYGWSYTAGPEVRKEIEGKLVSRTVMIDRVLPINPDGSESKTGTPPPVWLLRNGA